MTKGRKPKPTEFKRLAGNPGRRPLNDAEPHPPIILPDAPSELNAVGRAKWDELARKLFNQGILTELDIDLLYLYCINFQNFMDAQEKIKIFGGPVVKTEKGNPIQNPYLNIANQCQERMIKLASLFGMSPVDRSRIKAAPKAKPKSLAEKFFDASVAIPEKKQK